LIARGLSERLLFQVGGRHDAVASLAPRYPSLRLRRRSLARFPPRRSGGKGIPVVSNVKQPTVKQPTPGILAAPTAPELCQSETL
jgi:hypothetical protein